MKRKALFKAVGVALVMTGSIVSGPAVAHDKGYGHGYRHDHGYQGGAQMSGPCYGQQGMMNQGAGSGMMGQGMGPGMMGQGVGSGMMGQGMGPGMMGQGMGQGASSGMMGQGMGPGMMGQGAGSGMMGQGMGMGPPGLLDRDLSVDDVRQRLEHRLRHHGNERLRVGKVEATDDDIIVAEVETVDGSLVERYSFDRHTGRMQRAQ